MGTIIKLRDITYRYPLTEENALNGISLDVERGGLCGITGANGAGKSTLLMVIRGFIPGFFKGDLSGSVVIDGRDIGEYSAGELAHKIGYVFQNPFNQLSTIKDTVFEEIAFGLENYGIPREEIGERVAAIMDLTNTEKIALRNPLELSGGQLQRVAIASTLVFDPEILILDEPTSQLDPGGRKEIYRIVGDLKQRGTTILLVDHDTDLLSQYADQIVILGDGRIRAAGSPEAAFEDIDYNDEGVRLPTEVALSRRLHELGLPEIGRRRLGEHT